VGQGKETKTTLGVDSIGGVFVVLLCGLAVAVLIAIAEFCWNSKKSAAYENVRIIIFYFYFLLDKALLERFDVCYNNNVTSIVSIFQLS